MVLGFAAGLVISMMTTPVGISGAVFLLPVQLDVLAVPSPRVTPTNLLFNVIAVPGALVRYRRQGQLAGALVRRLLWGTVPGVILGAVLRIYLVPGAGVFRLLLALLLAPLGVLVLTRRPGTARVRWLTLSDRGVSVLAFGAGVAGGIYGIGGGSLLSPVLVATGLSVASVAPATLVTTLLTSIVGAGSYTLLALTAPGPVAPDWTLGIACGLGGLIGGYLGARWQPRLPQTALRVLLGAIAIALAVGLPGSERVSRHATSTLVRHGGVLSSSGRPRQAVRPSLTAAAAMISATNGSAQDQPTGC